MINTRALTPTFFVDTDAVKKIHNEVSHDPVFTNAPIHEVLATRSDIPDSVKDVIALQILTDAGQQVLFALHIQAARVIAQDLTRAIEKLSGAGEQN